MDFNFIRAKLRQDGALCYSKGLREYMLKVYNYMAGALGVTGIVAYLVASSDAALGVLYGTPLHWVVAFAPVIYVFFFHSRLPSMALETAKLLFWLFAVLMGISLSWIFVLYTGVSVARVFFVASSMFGIMAYFGNTTSMDLTSMGSFFMMGVLGLVLSSVINIFLQSSAFQFAISSVAVVVFAGLTAYDAQKIKEIYRSMSGQDDAFLSKAAIVGATTLYFDFINIFISMLHLFGDRK